MISSLWGRTESDTTEETAAAAAAAADKELLTPSNKTVEVGDSYVHYNWEKLKLIIKKDEKWEDVKPWIRRIAIVVPGCWEVKWFYDGRNGR